MSWYDDAACTGRLELFYTNNPAHRREAAALCAACPVVHHCDEARANEEVEHRLVHGFRAGRSAAERKADMVEANRVVGHRPETARQMRAVEVLINAGLSASEVGRELGINRRTVERHKRRLRDIEPDALAIAS